MDHLEGESSDFIKILRTTLSFHVGIANSGEIVCNGKEYPTNIYLYVDAGTSCMA